MFSKFGKEKTLFKTESFRVKYGTIDARTLDAIYIEIASWVEPLEMMDFESQIRLMRKKIINDLQNNINKNFFYEKFIVDLDLRSSGMMTNKKSFMMIEITVYPKTKHLFNSDYVKSNIKQIAESTIASVRKNKLKFYSKKINAKRRY